MNPKELFNNPAMCVVPWTGFIMEQNGNIKNCIASRESIGNINNDPIEKILADQHNINIKKNMLSGNFINNCNTCYFQEHGNAKGSNVISNRLFYRKEMRTVPLTLYDDANNFELHHVDMRWSNTCNLACVYCGPHNSSKWQDELGFGPGLDERAKEHTKEYVFKHAHQLKHVYLAGGEPLLMKENVEFLSLLLEVNPDVNLRINTNLSVLDTSVFDLVCKFKNVHWIVSVEATGKQFEYIRYGAKWEIFSKNLERIKTYEHKISFNMLWFYLNAIEIFSTIEYFESIGFHKNSFVISPLTSPVHLDVRNIEPQLKIDILAILDTLLDNKDSDALVFHGYSLMREHLCSMFARNKEETLTQIKVLDNRRNLDSKTIFPNLNS